MAATPDAEAERQLALRYAHERAARRLVRHGRVRRRARRQRVRPGRRRAARQVRRAPVARGAAPVPTSWNAGSGSGAPDAYAPWTAQLGSRLAAIEQFDRWLAEAPAVGLWLDASDLTVDETGGGSLERCARDVRRVIHSVAGGEAHGLVEGGGRGASSPTRSSWVSELTTMTNWRSREVGEGGRLVAGRRPAVADERAARQLDDLQPEAEHLALLGDGRGLHRGERRRWQQAPVEQGVEEGGRDRRAWTRGCRRTTTATGRRR